MVHKVRSGCAGDAHRSLMPAGLVRFTVAAPVDEDRSNNNHAFDNILHLRIYA
ncbi:hypothetical protein EPYR_01564 [Erwinia pyrifoliae DSM 12163]|nr:hypothetical protein EPYR_01564 [Erwinia pyrifoliae DSM 12163]